VQDVRLVYSVNGEPEQSLSLKEAREERPLEVAGEHLFYLEDFGLPH
jgi:hypothetical protein